MDEPPDPGMMPNISEEIFLALNKATLVRCLLQLHCIYAPFSRVRPARTNTYRSLLAIHTTIYHTTAPKRRSCTPLSTALVAALTSWKTVLPLGQILSVWQLTTFV